MSEAAQRLDIHLALASSKKFEYPWVYFTVNQQIWQVNLSQGIIFKGEKTWQYIPETYKEALTYLGLSHLTHCWQSIHSEYNVYQIDEGEINIVVSSTSYQSDWRIKGIKGLDPQHEYAMHCLNYDQSRRLNISYLSDYPLKHHSNLLLLTHGKEIAYLRDGQLSLHGTIHKKKLSLTRVSDSSILCNNAPSSITDLFVDFEQEQYIDIFFCPC